MKNQNVEKEEGSSNDLIKTKSNYLEKPQPKIAVKKDPNIVDKPKGNDNSKVEATSQPKKTVKPPKLEDKPFEEFISKYLIPGLKSSIEDKGTSVVNIQLIEGERPVVGGNCWMVFCEMSEERKFWLCFNKDIITSDKTILLAESNSNPSIVESFLIDEKKTTLPLLISRVLQRLNGQKWIGAN